MIQNSIFVVNKEPYCIWEVDIVKRNDEFLDGIDTNYFEYLLKVHLESDDEKRAAIALRATLHHAMETMFSLLGAYIQAPDCAYAWIAKCSNKDLRQLVKKIGGYHNTLFTKLNVEQVSWESISKLVFQCYMPDSERNTQTTKLFSSFWQRLAHEFIDMNHVDEYNSIKHGFRVRSGGFSLAIGLEHEYGVPPPADEMKMIGSSEHGSSFIKIEPVGTSGNNRSIKSKRTSINWKVEKVALLIQLVSMSINNIVSALKIANGAKAGTCQFLRPEEDADFERPWSYCPGVTSFNMDFFIKESDVKSTTREELLKNLNEHKKS
ncbi:MAG: hypothetical protein EHM79_18530 [Geobacter sp.]|nr:MAG: hypothetical protein EHM79_18530 [Geobacter sp.]